MNMGDGTRIASPIRANQPTRWGTHGTPLTLPPPLMPVPLGVLQSSLRTRVVSDHQACYMAWRYSNPIERFDDLRLHVPPRAILSPPPASSMVYQRTPSHTGTDFSDGHVASFFMPATALKGHFPYLRARVRSRTNSGCLSKPPGPLNRLPS